MSKRLIILVIIILFSYRANCQLVIFSKEIYLGFCDLHILSFNLKDSTVNTSFGDDRSKFIRLFDYDDKTGTFKFIFCDTSKKSSINGTLIIDKSKIYVRTFVGMSIGAQPKNTLKHVYYYKVKKKGKFISDYKCPI